jgi:hypothetical protein
MGRKNCRCTRANQIASVANNLCISSGHSANGIAVVGVAKDNGGLDEGGLGGGEHGGGVMDELAALTIGYVSILC